VLALVSLLPAQSFAQDDDGDGAPRLPSVQVGVPQGAPEAAPPPRPKPPYRATPRWPDGKPVMGSTPGEKVGLWGSCCGNLVASAVNKVVPFQPWAKAVYDDRRKNLLEPHTRCKPSGGARQFVTPYGTEIAEFRDLQQMIVFDIGGPHTFRTIYLDGRSHPANVAPSYYGHSIGWWEGDTLVVDTVGFNEGFWLDRGGLPSTEKMRTVERITRSNLTTLHYDLTVDDPGTYTQPWNGKLDLLWEEGTELFEYVCQEQNYAPELMVGQGTKVDRSSPIVP